MFLFYRLIPFFFLLLTGLGILGLFFFSAHFAFLILAMTLLGNGILFAALLKFQWHASFFWFFLLIPLCFLFSSFLLFFLLESTLMKDLICFILLFLPFLFLQYVFYYVHIPATHRPYAIEHLTLVLNVLSFFFLMTVSYGIHLFFHWPIFLLVVLSSFAIAFLLASIYWVSKIEWKRSFPFIFIGTLLLSEIFLAMSFLPTSLYTNAAILTILLYVFLETTRKYLLEKKLPKRLRLLLMGSGVLLIFVVASARWF